jgi:hypothetical protein
MAVDYLKTYLGIDPDDYSSMEARIRGEEPQAQAPVMMRQPMMMPQARSLGEMEAMPMAPRSQPTPQVDDRYQSLMDEIASLKAQIDALQTPVVEEAPMMPIEPEVAEAPMMPSAPSVTVEQLQNRMVDEPVPFVAQEPVPFQTQAPSQDIQASIDYLAKLPKMNIPQIPDIEQIRQKMEEANMTFPEPVSYQDQLQAIKDLPKITQMPTREEIQTAMQNIPTAYDANVTQNPFQKINDILPQSTIDQFQAVASKPNNFMGDSARNVMSQIQQPQMQSFGRPQLPFQGGFMPEMRAGGGGIDKAIYDLKFKLNG